MATRRRRDLFNPMGYDPPYYYDEDIPEERTLGTRRMPNVVRNWLSQGAVVTPPNLYKNQISKLDKSLDALDAKSARAEARREQAAKAGSKG